jgi:hypothetical protein
LKGAARGHCGNGYIAPYPLEVCGGPLVHRRAGSRVRRRSRQCHRHHAGLQPHGCGKGGLAESHNPSDPSTLDKVRRVGAPLGRGMCPRPPSAPARARSRTVRAEWRRPSAPALSRHLVHADDGQAAAIVAVAVTNTAFTHLRRLASRRSSGTKPSRGQKPASGSLRPPNVGRSRDRSGGSVGIGDQPAQRRGGQFAHPPVQSSRCRHQSTNAEEARTPSRAPAIPGRLLIFGAGGQPKPEHGPKREMILARRFAHRPTSRAGGRRSDRYRSQERRRVRMSGLAPCPATGCFGQEQGLQRPGPPPWTGT